MPKVGKKHFAYTKAGRKAAATATIEMEKTKESKRGGRYKPRKG